MPLNNYSDGKGHSNRILGFLVFFCVTNVVQLLQGFYHSPMTYAVNGGNSLFPGGGGKTSSISLESSTNCIDFLWILHCVELRESEKQKFGNIIWKIIYRIRTSQAKFKIKLHNLFLINNYYKSSFKTSLHVQLCYNTLILLQRYFNNNNNKIFI